MAKRPFIQWYPSDWRGDPKLQACSLEARGLWIEMIGIMHEAEPYGHLVVKGRAIDPETLAKLTGIRPQTSRKLMKELEENDVLSRTETGVIFSRRMVRDEQLRNMRAQGGRRSLENPNVPRPRSEGSPQGSPEGYPSRIPNEDIHDGSPHGTRTRVHKQIRDLPEDGELPGKEASTPPKASNVEINLNGAGRREISPHARLMPLLRELGFAADATDGDILKRLLLHNVSPDDIEEAARGLAILRDQAMLVRGYRIKPGEKLTMRILYAKKQGHPIPIWRQAQEAYYESEKRQRSPPAKTNLSSVSTQRSVPEMP